MELHSCTLHRTLYRTSHLWWLWDSVFVSSGGDGRFRSNIWVLVIDFWNLLRSYTSPDWPDSDVFVCLLGPTIIINTTSWLPENYCQWNAVKKMRRQDYIMYCMYRANCTISWWVNFCEDFSTICFHSHEHKLPNRPFIFKRFTFTNSPKISKSRKALTIV